MVLPAVLRRRRLRRAPWALGAVLAALAVFHPSAARAYDSIIRYGRTPVSYTFELEPHLVFGSDPPGAGYGSGAGVGFRASFVIAPEGFIRGVNDSVAIGAGLDFGHYYGAYGFDGYRDTCLNFEPGPAGTQVCTAVSSNGTYNYVFLPVVMQWNFWFTDWFSAFGEPGINLFYLGSNGSAVGPALYLGARFRIWDRISIAVRIGYPTASVGVAFLM